MINLIHHHGNTFNHRSYDDNVAERLRRSDPTLHQVSVRTGANVDRRYPAEQQPRNSFSSDELAAIVRSLQHNKTVQTLEFFLADVATAAEEGDDDSYDFSAVQDNELDSNHSSSLRMQQEQLPKQLEQTLATNCTLDTLKVTTETTSTEALDAQWVGLCRGLVKNTSIRTLQVSGGSNFISAVSPKDCLSIAASRALGELLLQTTSLATLSLKNLTLNTKGMQLLAAGLQQNTSLQMIELQQIECLHSSTLQLLIEAVATIRAPLHVLHVTECEFEFSSTASGSCSSSYYDYDDGDNDDDGSYWDSQTESEFGDLSECSYSQSRGCSSGLQHQQHPLAMLGNNHNASLLSELRFTDNIFDCDSFAAICLGLAHPRNSIKALDLTGNDLLGSNCAPPLSDMLTVNTSLQKLILEENILLDRGVITLCDGLSHNRTLRYLNLKANHLTAECCTVLEETLPLCELQTLILSENDIGDAGATMISKSLAYPATNLRRLDLDACLVSDEGIASLCHGLSSPFTALQELCIANNRCQSVGAQAVSDMLAVNTALTKLDLSACHIHNDTVAALLQSLSRPFQDSLLSCSSGSSKNANKSLLHLNLAFNALTDAGAQTVANMIASNQCRLTTLTVQCNHFSKRGGGERILARSVQHNTYLQELYFWSPGGDGGSNRKNENDKKCNKRQQEDEKSDHKLMEQLEHWLALNRAGRWALQEYADKLEHWPNILARAGSEYEEDALYYLLRERPELMLLRAPTRAKTSGS